MRSRGRITEALYSDMFPLQGGLSDIYISEKQTVQRGREAAPSSAVCQSKAIYGAASQHPASLNNCGLLYKRKLHEEVTGDPLIGNVCLNV